ncbi:MAG TPA: hypothetical protein VE090_01480 [Methylomirabilota bacterium]|nr:hypothetical protein [Methylomirabilota bacterium]
MKRHFYHHLIEIDSLHLALEDLDLEPHEKEDLVIIIDTNLHHTIIAAILPELSEDDKKTFLSFVVTDDQQKIWELLTQKVTDVESKIKQATEQFTKKMHEDIKKAHTVK